MLLETLHVTHMILSVSGLKLFAFASERHDSQICSPTPAIDMCHKAMNFSYFSRACTFGRWRRLRALPALPHGIQLMLHCMRGRQRSSGKVPVIE